MMRQGLWGRIALGLTDGRTSLTVLFVRLGLIVLSVGCRVVRVHVPTSYAGMDGTQLACFHYVPYLYVHATGG